jgi:hypothetical protein
MAIPILELRLDKSGKVLSRRAISLAETVSESEKIAEAAAAKHPTHGFDEMHGYWWGMSDDGHEYRYCRE